MTALQEYLLTGCRATGLPIDLDYIAVFAGGTRIECVARICDVGAPNGMLITTSYDVLRRHLRELDEAGFGFSVHEEPPEHQGFDLEVFKEMVRDWGWREPTDPLPTP